MRTSSRASEQPSGFTLTLILAITALTALPAAIATRPIAEAQEVVERAGFVTTLGRDTVVLESFTRSARRLEGWIVVRIPGTVLVRYELALDGDGNLTRSLLRTRPLNAPDVVASAVTLDAIPDSVRVTVEASGKRTITTRPLARGTPVVYMSGFGSSHGLYAALGMYELMLPGVPVSPSGTTTVSGVSAASGRAAKRQFIRPTRTNVSVDYFGIAWSHFVLDEAGRILSTNGMETTEKTLTVRTGPIDIERAAEAYAALDRRGAGLGVASPDTVVQARVGAASITLRYGSPRKRGREILGHVVPYGAVWRTGANAATSFTTSHPLLLGEAEIPAGRYTLYTQPSRDGVQLIVNREVGQWGTSYDSSKDLLRIPMRVRSVATREDFFIGVAVAGPSAELRIAWDTFEWSVPVRIK